MNSKVFKLPIQEKLDVVDYKNFILNPIRNNVDDIYIACISFEPRSICVLKRIEEGYKCSSGIFIINNKFRKLPNVKSNVEKTIKLVKNFFSEYAFLYCSIDNPIKALIQLDKIVKNKINSKKDGEKLSITIDISSFPRGELLAILYYLRHLGFVQHIRIFYASPLKYGSWLSIGFKKSIVPPFFEGPSTFEKKQTALIILTGFEVDRPVYLIDEIEPSYLLLCSPFPGTSEDFHSYSGEIINIIKTQRKINHNVIKITANDPFKCRNELLPIIKDLSKNYNIYMAILGTKIELLGAYLCYELLENKPLFRIIYPLPLMYNVEDYSTGCRDIYQFIIK